MTNITIIQSKGLYKACQCGKVILWSKNLDKLVNRIKTYIIESSRLDF